MSSSGLNFFHQYQRKLTITLICIAAIYLLGIVLSGQPNIAKTLTAFPLVSWLFILSCSLFSYLIRFIRWLTYADTLGHKLPIIRHFLYYLAGFSLTTTPGKSGETVRALFLTEYNVPVKHTLAMFFSERLLDLVIVIALATLALAVTSDYQLLIYILVAMVITLVYLIHKSQVVKLISWLGHRLPGNKIKWLCQQLTRLIESARTLLSFKLISQGLALGSIAWLSQAFAFYFITWTLNLNLSFHYAVAAYSLGVLAGAASLIPGGIGSSEAVMALLLKLMGIDFGTAIAVALISRLSTVWFMVIVGLCSVTIISFLQPGNTVKE